VRESDTVEIARNSLSERFGLSEIQAAAIVDMRLRTLTGLERQKIEDEYAGLLKTIAELQDILASERRLLGVVRTETEDLKKRLGDPRKTPVEALEGELSIEDIIEDTEVVVTVTVGGYIKRVSVDTFRAQNRGGRGVIGISNLKKEDVVQNFFVATTHQHVCSSRTRAARSGCARTKFPDSHAPGARHGARQPAHAAAGRERQRGVPGAQLRHRRVSRDGHAQGRHQEDEAR
jgi:DNA gyrase subunit A